MKVFGKVNETFCEVQKPSLHIKFLSGNYFFGIDYSTNIGSTYLHNFIRYQIYFTTYVQKESGPFREGVPFFLDSNPVKLKESVSPLCIKALRNS